MRTARMPQSCLLWSWASLQLWRRRSHACRCRRGAAQLRSTSWSSVHWSRCPSRWPPSSQSPSRRLGGGRRPGRVGEWWML
uniref:Putative secreted protein n=1 Tax=Ixodes ricinus TaxID=34613 RepID=A0A6B0U716_IXORI